MPFDEYLSSQFTLAQNLEFFFRVLIAGVFGAAIGIERTRRFKEAGIRTHVIVCTASALMMIISKYAFQDVVAADGIRGADPARVAAQVISGISFLGAGVIFKNGSTVKGLTTAAGIWATAGIGLAVGAGMYWLGLFVTVLVALLQVAMHRFTFGGDAYETHSLRVRVENGESFYDVLHLKLKAWGAQTVNSRMSRYEDGSVLYELTLRMPRGLSADEVMAFSRDHSEILEISVSQVG